jgi:hypothetical protein
MGKMPGDFPILAIGSKLQSKKLAKLADTCSHKFFACSRIVLGKNLRKTAIPFKAARREQKRKKELVAVLRFLESRSQTILKGMRPASEVGQIKARTASAVSMIVGLNSGNECIENPGDAPEIGTGESSPGHSMIKSKSDAID